MELLDPLFSATACARAIRAGEVSSVEVTEVCLRRIDAVNPRLNAVVQVAGERALEEARRADIDVAEGRPAGLLHGVPITIKDTLEAAGLVCAAGTAGRSAFVPDRDATVVARLRAAGAVVLGKTNVPELTLAVETDNFVYGRTSNPYDLSRSPGGSSGGEAAIVAAGGSMLGVGSDGGGSVRLPAHFCGIAGLRPTTRRVPRTGHVPAALGVYEPLLAIGALARRVEDLYLALRVMAGPSADDPAIPPVPLGDPAALDVGALRGAFFVDDGLVPPTPEIAEAVTAAARALDGEAASIEEARPDGLAEACELYSAILSADGGAGIRALLESFGTAEVNPLLNRLFALIEPGALSCADFGGALVRADLCRRTAQSFFERYDFVLSPVCAEAAMPHGSTSAMGGIPPSISYSMPAGLFGWPACVVRIGTSPGGLPIGVQIQAAHWRENVVLAVGARLEERFGGWRPPDL